MHFRVPPFGFLNPIHQTTRRVSASFDTAGMQRGWDLLDRHVSPVGALAAVSRVAEQMLVSGLVGRACVDRTRVAKNARRMLLRMPVRWLVWQRPSPPALLSALHAAACAGARGGGAATEDRKHQRGKEARRGRAEGARRLHQAATKEKCTRS